MASIPFNAIILPAQIPRTFLAFYFAATQTMQCRILLTYLIHQTALNNQVGA